ncbi:hypothetical protein ACFVVM_32440 [Nocardia sp. NPDC058176]|uniref:hypothetical protein n=1 Tax=Nocardia sp. NPDC058176 TaxID=3346368 RepID=UPI0036D978D8
MMRPDIRLILPSPQTVLEAFATPEAVIPHRRPELIAGLHRLHTLHRAYRAASTDVATEGLPESVLRDASASVTSLGADIEHTVFEIDAEVARRLDAHGGASFDAPLHTESIGAILSRVALLWIEVDAHREGTQELPAAVELFELIGAYGSLREAIASGNRQLPTVRRPCS